MYFFGNDFSTFSYYGAVQDHSFGAKIASAEYTHSSGATVFGFGADAFIMPPATVELSLQNNTVTLPLVSKYRSVKDLSEDVAL